MCIRDRRHTNYGSLIGDLARYWSKIADLNLPHLYLTPRRGVKSGWIFAEIFDIRKLRVPGLSYDVCYVIIGLAVVVQVRLVTDRRTDGQTDRRTDTR